MPKFGKWTSVWGIVTIILIIETIIFAAILLFYRTLIIEYLDYLGWGLLVLSIYFALAPVYAFKKKSNVWLILNFVDTIPSCRNWSSFNCSALVDFNPEQYMHNSYLLWHIDSR